MILVNGSPTPLSRIRSSPVLAGLAPEAVSDSKGLEKPMIPVGVLLQAGFEVLAAKMKKTPASRGCPLRAAPLHQRQQSFHKSSRFSGIAMPRHLVYFMQSVSKTYPSNRNVL